MSVSKFLTKDELDGVAAVEAALAAEVKEVTTVIEIDPDTASVAELRLLVKELIKRQGMPPVEPLGIDSFEHLPVFFEKPECPRCQPFSESWRDPETGSSYAICHDCAGPIPHSMEFQNRGIESVTVDHLHLHTIPSSRGAQVRIPVKRELCLPCFRIDWAKVNPDKPCDL